MATIDATIGGTAANSYVTVAEADTYFDGRLYATAWTEDATEDDKIKALITATDRLDREDYYGYRWEEDQRLKWPRSGVATDDGVEIAFDEIPRQLKDATCELALALLGTDLLSESGLGGFDELEVGPLKLVVRHIPTGSLTDNVLRNLRGLVKKRGRGQIRLNRG
jgi:hypothetical protein